MNVSRSKGDCHVFLFICDRGSPCYVSGFRRNTNVKQRLSGEARPRQFILVLDIDAVRSGSPQYMRA